MKQMLKLVYSIVYKIKIICELRYKVSKLLSRIINFDNDFISKELLKKYNARWKKIFVFSTKKWCVLYSLRSKTFSLDYVPEDIYYTIIEPALNDSRFTITSSDKNFYDKGEYKELFPEVILRNISGVYYNNHYELITDYLDNILLKEEKVIVKPSIDSGGGRGVKIFTRQNDFFLDENNKKFTKEYIEFLFKKDFLVQKYIKPNSYFSQFNSSSVNTLRIFTYRSVLTNVVHILGTVLRMGNDGAFIDNASLGGEFCRVNKNGVLDSYLYNLKGPSRRTLKDRLNIDCFEPVYKFNEIIALVKSLAKNNLYCRILGFDVTIDSSSRIKVVEINTKYIGINCLQLTGVSLFGDFTDEIIEYCHNLSIRESLLNR